MYVAGDFYTYTYPDLLGGTVGFPSPGDAIYLSVYPALFIGLMLLVRRRDPHGRDRSAVVDSLILTVGFALLSWVFLVAPNLHLSGLTILAKLVSVAYPLGDVLLLGALIRFAVQAGAKGPAFYLLVAGTVGLLATDCAYNYALLAGTYNHQLVYDAGWLAYLVLWGAAALHPSMRGLEEPAADTRVRLTPTRLALLAFACLVAPGIHFVEELGNTDLLVVIGASAILFLLVVLRMAGLVRQEERATARELALRARRPGARRSRRACERERRGRRLGRPDRRAVGEGEARPLDAGGRAGRRVERRRFLGHLTRGGGLAAGADGDARACRRRRTDRAGPRRARPRRGPDHTRRSPVGA